MRGPQCAGMLIGRKDLVAYALLNNSPHEDTLGRSQKVGQRRNHRDGESAGIVSGGRPRCPGKRMAGAAGSNLQADHEGSGRSAPHSSFPTSRITFPTCRSRGTGENFSDSEAGFEDVERARSLSIVMGGGEGKPGLAMNSFMLQPGEDKIVCREHRLSKTISASIPREIRIDGFGTGRSTENFRDY